MTVSLREGRYPLLYRAVKRAGPGNQAAPLFSHFLSTNCLFLPPRRLTIPTPEGCGRRRSSAGRPLRYQPIDHSQGRVLTHERPTGTQQEWTRAVAPTVPQGLG